jgi:cytochrome c oxidase cbb3-type subunit III
MADQDRIDHATGTGFVGHEWDGIEELDTPMPRWWLWTFYATILWGAAYTIAYPAWPLLESATAGALGWSSRTQLAAELDSESARRAPLVRAIAATPVAALPENPRLMTAAVAGGESAFKVHCIQCHGTGAAGIEGQYPNLIDDDWLWGGDLATIEYTLIHGIRNPDHAETRNSAMPAFGRDAILDSRAINDVVSHVRLLARLERPSTAAGRGAAVYAAQCASCHGPDGKGDRSVGAPNLTDAVWLYGNDRASLTATVHKPRNGVMPRWGDRLDPVTIKMLAAYVHSRGGGEAAPLAAPPLPPTAMP